MANKNQTPRTPRVVILDEDKNKILDKFGVPVEDYLVGFSYEYIDDEDDECLLQFQAANVFLPDTPKLQSDIGIIVGWGYLDEPEWVYRQVAIRKTRTQYLNDKILLELSCSDHASYLKRVNSTSINDVQNSENEDDGDTFQNYLKRIQQENDITIKIETPVDIKADSIRATLRKVPEWEKQRDKRWKESGFIDQTAEEFLDKKARKEAEALVRRDSIRDAVRQEQATKDSLISKALEEFDNDTLMQKLPTNLYMQNRWNTINEAIERAENGPYFLSGRDKELVIHNRKRLKQEPPLAVLEYGNDGEIISFVPEDKSKYNDMRSLRSTTVNKKTGEVDTNEVITPKNNNQESANGLEKTNQVIKTIIQSYKKDSTFQVSFDAIDLISQVSHTSSAPGFVDPSTGVYRESQENVSVARTYVTPFIQTITKGDSEIVIRNIIENEIKKTQQNNRPAGLKVIGDTKYEDRKNIVVKGFAEIHNDEYYIQRAKHIINANGYIVEMEVLGGIKEARKLVININQTIEDVIFDKQGKVSAEDLIGTNPYEDLLERTTSSLDQTYFDSWSATNPESDETIVPFTQEYIDWQNQKKAKEEQAKQSRENN